MMIQARGWVLFEALWPCVCGSGWVDNPDWVKWRQFSSPSKNIAQSGLSLAPRYSGTKGNSIRDIFSSGQIPLHLYLYLKISWRNIWVQCQVRWTKSAFQNGSRLNQGSKVNSIFTRLLIVGFSTVFLHAVVKNTPIPLQFFCLKLILTKLK